MEVPKRNIYGFARELVEECLASQVKRRANYSYYRSMFFTGTEDGGVAKFNKIYSHIDRLGSLLFSPSDVRFTIDSSIDETDEWSEPFDLASRHINREFYRRRCGLAFSQALEVGLYKGAGFIKATYGHNGIEPYVVHPDFMGVMREDVDDLDRQEAFVHSFYVTPSQLKRLVYARHDKSWIMDQVANGGTNRSESDFTDSYLYEIIVGGIHPIQNTPTGYKGSIGNVLGPPTPMLAPEVSTRLIRIDELWVFNQDQKRTDGGLGDWTTIRIAEPGVVIEGDMIHRNLSDIPGEHPFIKVCANDIPGYFWGRSEIAQLAELQTLLNARINNADDIIRKQANPPRAFRGFSGLTDEKAAALSSVGGRLIDGNPSTMTSIDSLGPTMPADLLPYIRLILEWFDESGGMTGMLTGQGEPGVRAGAHAGALMKTAAARIRDRALAVEWQVAAFGETTFKMDQAKNASVFKCPNGQEFMLSQLPADANVTVDSHSSSPAFSGENVNLSFALARAGAIGLEDLLEDTQPPHMEKKILRLRKRQAQQAKLVQEHPELLTKGKGGHK